MIKKILLVVGLLVAAFLVYVGVQPPEFHMERSILISAEPAQIFPHLNNLKKSLAWNPWIEKDPNVNLSYSGPEEGLGSQFSWKGNSDAGAGTAIVAESADNEKVVVDLHFTEPMAGDAKATYTLAKEGDQTRVTWGFVTKQPFIARVFCTLFNMKKIMAKEFDEGLNKLKQISEVPS